MAPCPSLPCSGALHGPCSCLQLPEMSTGVLSEPRAAATGGLAPTRNCTKGEEVAVPNYAATYTFYTC